MTVIKKKFDENEEIIEDNDENVDDDDKERDDIIRKTKREDQIKLSYN